MQSRPSRLRTEPNDDPRATGSFHEACKRPALESLLICLDARGQDADAVIPPSDSPQRVFRGGGFAGSAPSTRASARTRTPPETQNFQLGLRPARRIAP